MNCDHFIGFTLDTRHEEFIQYYVSDNVEDVNAISYKFDYCPLNVVKKLIGRKINIMKSYSFEVAHGYQILFGCVTADTKEEAEKKILNEDWDDIIDEYDSETLTEGYEIVDIW